MFSRLVKLLITKTFKIWLSIGFCSFFPDSAAMVLITLLPVSHQFSETVDYDFTTKFGGPVAQIISPWLYDKTLYYALVSHFVYS